MRIKTDIFAYCAASAKIQFYFCIGVSHAGGWGVGRSRTCLYIGRWTGLCQSGVAAGLDVDQFSTLVIFLWYKRIFLEGKIAAARVLWSELMQEHFEQKIQNR